MFKVYRGSRGPDGVRVRRETYQGSGGLSYFLSETDDLPLRLDLGNHSPMGFEWGYVGSGPHQLALAMLADATGRDNLAKTGSVNLLWERVQTLPRTSWQLSQLEILEWVALQVSLGLEEEAKGWPGSRLYPADHQEARKEASNEAQQG